MRGHRLGEPAAGGGIEAGDRLVEQPERARRGEKPRQRQPPPLPLRQELRRRLAERQEADRLERILGAFLGRLRPALPRCPEDEVGEHGLLRFQRVLVADEVRIGRQRRALQRDRALFQRAKPRDSPEQSGLARAVRPSHNKGVTRRDSEGDRGQDKPPASLHRHVSPFKAHIAE